jgi:hypothetical protein
MVLALYGAKYALLGLMPYGPNPRTTADALEAVNVALGCGNGRAARYDAKRPTPDTDIIASLRPSSANGFVGADALVEALG